MAEKIYNFITQLDLLVVVLVAVAFLIVLYIAMLIRSMVLAKRDAAYYARMQANQRLKLEKKDRRLRNVYGATKKIPVVKKLLTVIETSFLSICPYDDVYLIRLTSETVVITFIVAAITVLVILAFNLYMDGQITLYAIGCCVFIVYVVGIECLNHRVSRTDKKIVNDMTKYISAVKHAFLACRSIPQAISQAAEGLGHEINLFALMLYDILTGTEREERVREYALAPTTNKNMKLFIQQAYEVSESGDIIGPDSQSLFVSNMEFLRVDMKKGLYRKELRAFKLQGNTITCIVPLLVLPLLKKWGMDFAPEMESFYDGVGVFIVFVCFVATFVVYNSINRAKDVVFRRTNSKRNMLDNLPLHNRIRRVMDKIELFKGEFWDKTRKMISETGTNQTLGSLVITMFLYGLLTVGIGTAFFSVMHVQAKQRALTEVNNIDSIITVATEQTKDKIKTHILDMTNDYLHADNISIKTIETDFATRMYLPNKVAVNAIATEVQERVLSCRNEYLKWYEFYASIILGVCACFIPYIGLRYRHSLFLSGRSDEVQQFQSIVLMERLFPNMTCPKILEEMETFAYVFKPAIRNCINSYSSGPTQALLELKKSTAGQDEGFTELVEGFLSVESVGIATAFAEVSNNRELAQMSKELEDDKILAKQRDSVEILAVVPAIIAVGFYFILPFAIYVLSNLSDMFTMLDEFQGLL